MTVGDERGPPLLHRLAPAVAGRDEGGAQHRHHEQHATITTKPLSTSTKPEARRRRRPWPTRMPNPAHPSWLHLHVLFHVPHPAPVL